MSYKTGVDVSHHDGLVDWEKVKEAEYTFAITKATEGLKIVDAQFKRNWQVIPTKMDVRGAYHFAHPQEDMGAQGVFFAHSVGPLKPKDIVFVDIEATFGADGKTDLWLDYNEATRRLKLDHFLAFADKEFTQLSGHPVSVGIYTDAGNWNDYFNQSYDHSGRKLWLASVSDTLPHPIGQWKKVNIWQHNFTGKVPGIESEVDLNYWVND